MEYWSLEQAKLGKEKPNILEGRVVYVTGGASGIGKACVEVFGKAGANVFVADISQEALDVALKDFKTQKLSVQGVVVDVTKPQEVTNSFKKMIQCFGGADILISNAGRAFQADGMARCPDEILRESMDVNFFAHQYCAANSVQVMQLQQSGGVLLFNASKAALNPGKNFGPYSIAKAAVLALMKQYALEYASVGIRSNAVNPDRVRTNLFSPELIQQRAAARNLHPDEYFRSNLLHQEVTPLDVANAFLHLALSSKTTAAMLAVDGGNIEASVR